jgi:hypothetical protein
MAKIRLPIFLGAAIRIDERPSPKQCERLCGVRWEGDQGLDVPGFSSSPSLARIRLTMIPPNALA